MFHFYKGVCPFINNTYLPIKFKPFGGERLFARSSVARRVDRSAVNRRSCAAIDRQANIYYFPDATSVTTFVRGPVEESHHHQPTHNITRKVCCALPECVCVVTALHLS